jgi:glutamate synthase (NADPH/NADH) small chain
MLHTGVEQPMGKPTGFIEFRREKQPYRPVEERIRDWQQVMRPWPDEKLRVQGARCMDCGVPFCHQGCPLGNLIPDWNDLVYRNQWREALVRLHATNSFPEFTGTLCPAPCEGSCVLGINDQPVSIRAIELAIIERGFEEGWVQPKPPSLRTGKQVAVVGSGPAGLAAAHQLNRFGHQVVVFERADRIGGLLRYGIPEFKLEKRVVDRRLELMAKEGVEFRTGVHVGGDLPVSQLRRNFDALLLAGGSTVPRDLPVPGRELGGIHFAMQYLTQQNRVLQGESIPAESRIRAEGKRVVIIGGGDTGADCLGTVHRQNAASVHQLELLPRPPERRAEDNPWPEWPMILRSSAAHEEGGIREFSVNTTHFSGEFGRVRALHGQRVQMVKDGGRTQFRPIAGSEFTLEVELVILAMGFSGPERGGLLSELGVKMTERGTVDRNQNWMTNVEGVFVAGDMQRGQSLIVWAIADGRDAARGVDTYLMGDSHR